MPPDTSGGFRETMARRRKNTASITRALLMADEQEHTVPELPDTPETPDNPDPDNPDNPNVPDQPGLPEQPDVPSDGTPPYIPDTPAPSQGILLGSKTYFDTGLFRTPLTCVCLECDTANINTRYYNSFFGESGTYSNRFYLRLMSSALKAYDMQPHDLQGYVKGKNKFIGDVKRKQWYINSDTPQDFYNKSVTDNSVNRMFLGAVCDMSAKPSEICGGLIIHRFRVWENDSLVMCLVPAEDESGNACLMDTVSGRFIHHTGTGNVTLL